MKPIKLSICIASLSERSKMLGELVGSLAIQPRFDECELIVVVDAGQMQTGSKRNRILDIAQGEFVACVDDDDQVAYDYIPRILEAIEADEGVHANTANDHCFGDSGPVDAILIDGICMQSYGSPKVYFDYELDGIEGRWVGEPFSDGSTIWRSPGHLCPIRTSVARRVQFPQPARGEDLAWSAQLRHLIKTARRAKSSAIGGSMYFYRLDNSKQTPRSQHMERSHQEIFTPQYVSKSGPGSTVGYSQPYRKWLQDFMLAAMNEPCTRSGCLEHPEDLHFHPIEAILDLGCGDMNVMGNVEMRGARYLGIDVIKDRIEQNRQRYDGSPSMTFMHLDLRSAELEADLILCKDVLQHWSAAEITEWLARVELNKHRFRYMLITNCNYGPTVNKDIDTGGWRALDLTKPPFNIGERVFSWGDEIGGYKDVVLIKGTK